MVKERCLEPSRCALFTLRVQRWKQHGVGMLKRASLRRLEKAVAQSLRHWWLVEIAVSEIEILWTRTFIYTVYHSIQLLWWLFFNLMVHHSKRFHQCAGESGRVTGLTTEHVQHTLSFPRSPEWSIRNYRCSTEWYPVFQHHRPVVMICWDSTCDNYPTHVHTARACVKAYNYINIFIYVCSMHVFIYIYLFIYLFNYIFIIDIQSVDI